MSYAVTQRTQEIGIRMALGASTMDVLKLIIRNGMMLVIIGVAIGIVGSVCFDKVDDDFVVWRNCHRRSDDVVCLVGFDRSGFARLFHSRAPSNESRSAGGPSLRMRRLRCREFSNRTLVTASERC